MGEDYLNSFDAIFDNDILVIAFVSWFIAQLIKVILTALKDKRLVLSRIAGAGGFPSSHSSFVMGLSTAIGLQHGFDSTYYAIGLAFSLVVMYDASGVRRAVGKQATIINAMIDDMYAHKPIEQERMKELVGHTPFEVIAGAILGTVLANLMM